MRKHSKLLMAVVASVATMVTLAVAALWAAVALADSASFKSASASGPAADGSLTVSFREVGLGNTPNPVDYTASANADALYACQNNGGGFPNDPKKQHSTGPVSKSGTFVSGKNGSVSGSLTIDPPASTLSCPGGQHAVLVSISYTNVKITDVDHNVSANISGTFSRTFYTI
jgi:hypothetical protein